MKHRASGLSPPEVSEFMRCIDFDGKNDAGLSGKVARDPGRRSRCV
jgi:hypothetical protein